MVHWTMSNSRILTDDWRHLRKSETLRDTEVWSSLGLRSLGRSSKQADVTLKGATTSYVGATIPYSCVGSPRDRVGWCWQAGDSKFLPLKMLSASLNSSPSLHINNKGKGIMRRSGDGSLWSHFSSLFRQLHRKRSFSKIKTFSVWKLLSLNIVDWELFAPYKAHAMSEKKRD